MKDRSDVDAHWETDWAKWIVNPWYAHVVEYLVTGDLGRGGPLAETDLIVVQKKARRFRLVDEATKRLAHKERD